MRSATPLFRPRAALISVCGATFVAPICARAARWWRKETMEGGAP